MIPFGSRIAGKVGLLGKHHGHEREPRLRRLQAAGREIMGKRALQCFKPRRPNVLLPGRMHDEKLAAARYVKALAKLAQKLATHLGWCVTAELPFDSRVIRRLLRRELEQSATASQEEDLLRVIAQRRPFV